MILDTELDGYIMNLQDTNSNANLLNNVCSDTNSCVMSPHQEYTYDIKVYFGHGYGQVTHFIYTYNI